jgi:hypothetical protein
MNPAVELRRPGQSCRGEAGSAEPASAYEPAPCGDRPEYVIRPGLAAPRGWTRHARPDDAGIHGPAALGAASSTRADTAKIDNSIRTGDRGAE